MPDGRTGDVEYDGTAPRVGQAVHVYANPGRHPDVESSRHAHVWWALLALVGLPVLLISIGDAHRLQEVDAASKPPVTSADGAAAPPEV